MAASRLGHPGEARADAASPTRGGERLATGKTVMGRDS